MELPQSRPFEVEGNNILEKLIYLLVFFTCYKNLIGETKQQKHAVNAVRE